MTSSNRAVVVFGGVSLVALVAVVYFVNQSTLREIEHVGAGAHTAGSLALSALTARWDYDAFMQHASPALTEKYGEAELRSWISGLEDSLGDLKTMGTKSSAAETTTNVLTESASSATVTGRGLFEKGEATIVLTMEHDSVSGWRVTDLSSTIHP